MYVCHSSTWQTEEALLAVVIIVTSKEKYRHSLDFVKILPASSGEMSSAWKYFYTSLSRGIHMQLKEESRQTFRFHRAALGLSKVHFVSLREKCRVTRFEKDQIEISEEKWTSLLEEAMLSSSRDVSGTYDNWSCEIKLVLWGVSLIWDLRCIKIHHLKQITLFQVEL